MKLVKAIVRPDKVDEVRDALEKIKVSGMTVTDVPKIITGRFQYDDSYTIERYEATGDRKSVV